MKKDLILYAYQETGPIIYNEILILQKGIMKKQNI